MNHMMTQTNEIENQEVFNANCLKLYFLRAQVFSYYLQYLHLKILSNI